MDIGAIFLILMAVWAAISAVIFFYFDIPSCIRYVRGAQNSTSPNKGQNKKRPLTEKIAQEEQTQVLDYETMLLEKDDK